MFRESNTDFLHWADKTWSVLHARQLEASEDRLAAWPQFGLFTVSDPAGADALWQLSYARQEDPLGLERPTLAQLRERVLQNLRQEALMLSIDELHLVYDMVENGGTIELLDMEDMGVAESLVRRLWCWQEWLPEDRVLLHLPQKLMLPLLSLLEEESFQTQTARLYQLYASLHALLYLHGAVRSREVLPLLRELAPECSEALALRWMKAGFDCAWHPSAGMLLIHPGLAEPEALKDIRPLPRSLLELDPEQIYGDIPGVLPEETAVFCRMTGLLQDAVRPELTPEEATEDLLILAKQNVAEPVMQEVLATLVTVHPSPAMKEVARLISRQTPRWPGFSPGVVN